MTGTIKMHEEIKNLESNTFIFAREIITLENIIWENNIKEF